MIQSKALTYVNFAIKAGKARTGVNVAKTLKSREPLVIMCGSASDNTKNEIIKIAGRLNAKIIITCGISLEEIFGKENCKLTVITDWSLAKAILANTDEYFVLFGGNKI